MNKEQGNFICECGKDFSIQSNLRRHQKTCNAQNLMEQSGSEREQSIEGMTLISSQ